MERRYRALRMIASVLQVLAWVSLVLGLLSAIAYGAAAIATASRLGLGAFAPLARFRQFLWPVGMGGFGGIVGALVLALGSVLGFLFLYAASDLINVQLDIEQNTRETAVLLRERHL